MMRMTRLVFWALLTLASPASPAFPATLTRGPYLQLQEPDSIHVVWLTDSACTGEVEWGLTTSYGQVASSAESVTRHEMAITGLNAGTLYHYRVRSAGTPLSADATFRTAPASSASSASFAFVGDSCSAPANCTATYTAMRANTPNGFCVTVGDLAGRGEDNITDYWKTHFFDPARDFVKQVAMYTCLGNHEAYDESSFPDFVYPAKYLANWSLPPGSGSELYYSFDKGPVHFASMDVWWTPYSAGSPQYNWLANDLAASNKPWKIVFAHNGPYVSQLNKSDGSSTIRSALVPLLEQRGVDLYLNGHYHEYQRNKVNGVTYIVQGTGGQTLGGQSDDSQAYVQEYASDQYCYTRINAQANRLLGWCIKTSGGAILDAFQLDKPAIGMPWQDTFPTSGPELNWTAPLSYETHCGRVTHSGNPSGDGSVFAVGDSSGHQFCYPMLAGGSLAAYSFESQVFYDAASPVQTRLGLGIRGRQFFDANKRVYYALFFVRNDPLAANGHCVLVRQNAGVESLLTTWPGSDVSGWHKLKFSASGSELSVWIDDQLMTATPVNDTTSAKGRPFIYNYRASSTGAKTLVDDVRIDGVVASALITDFESYAAGTQAMFCQPSYSSTTSANIATSPNSSAVVAASAFGGTKACQVDWAFVDTAPSRWLRLTTHDLANVGNPTLDLTRPITFRYRLVTPGSLRMCLGIRETGNNVPIGANGGTTGTMEWLGATSVVGGVPQGQLISDQGGAWQQITFDPLVDPVQAFTGDGLLSASNNKGVLEHIALTAVDVAGPISVQFDMFEQPWRDPITTPVITGHPQNQPACPGAVISFAISASGSALSYRWQKDEIDLADGGGYGGTGSSVLSISNVQNGHGGAYRCRVSNLAGSATSNIATLTVHAVTSITGQPQPRTVFAGQSASFSVAALGAGQLSYLWQKDGVDLTEDPHYSGLTANTLVVSNALSAQAGLYRCVVTGVCGSETSEAAGLNINPAFKGDFDYDGDVDQEDFSFLQLCLDRQLDPLCAEANLVSTNSTIDQADVTLFHDCMTGPGGTPSSSCAK